MLPNIALFLFLAAHFFISPTPPPHVSHIIQVNRVQRTLGTKGTIPTPTEPTQITPEITVFPTATPTPQNAPLSDVGTYLLQQVNTYRQSQGLGTVQANSTTCNFAQTRAREISTDFSHNGFQSRINSHTQPYPSYSLVTENIAETSNYKDVVTMWANSPEHAANMRAATPYICVAQYGNFYALEGWKP